MSKENIDSVVETFLQRTPRKERDHVRIRLGVRPSGVIHPGNMNTIASAFLVGHSFLERGFYPRIEVCYCDLSYDGGLFFELRDVLLRKPSQTYPNFAEENIAVIDPFLQELSESTRVPYLTERISNIQRTIPFREYLLKLLDAPPPWEGGIDRGVDLAYEEMTGTFQISVVPQPDDPLSQWAGLQYLRKVDDIWSMVFSKSGKIAGRYRLDDVQNDVILHPPLEIAIKTALFKPDIHILGGDYLICKHGNSMYTSIKRMVRYLCQGEPTLFTFAPLFLDAEGERISKSEPSSLTLTNLQRMKGDAVVPLCLAFAESAFGKQCIPYEEIVEGYHVH